MVVINNTLFSHEDEYNEYFNEYPYELSNFQKWAIYSIINNDNTLITAHTGSGKTLPAEFSINYFVKKGKKVIYTSPIKALSNQKFFEFQEKFPDITIGILTGDNKHNPEADVLIMTTEILRNKLLNIIPKTEEKIIPINELNQFSMDIEKECGIVIFDEIHYIDDKDRGAVWEQSIMHMPKNIPMLMLSASIGKPEVFGAWIESIHPDKKVNICPTNERVVPLQHYSYVTIPDSYLEKIQDKQLKNLMIENINELMVLKDDKNNLLETNFSKLNKINHIIENHSFRVQRKFVINNLLKYLRNNKMLPALCFVFSRKQVEMVASEITETLWTEEELYEDPVTNTIEHSCKQLLISKVTNWREYINIPEYHFIIKCLKRGVGFHHAGMIPIFKEIIEIMYSKKKIKILIATETFAVGLNMPTKTVIFTSLYKYNGHVMRLLEGHEYTQMAGRAGRRNIDTRGYIIHLNNLFEMPETITYKHLIHTPPKVIKSRFKIGIPFIMNIIASSEYETNKDTDYLCKHIEKSMMINDINNSIKICDEEYEYINKKIQEYNIDNLKKYEEYDELKNSYIKSKNKQKKRIGNQIKDFEKNNDNTNDRYKEYLEYKKILQDRKKNRETKKYAESYISGNVLNIISILKINHFLDHETKLTMKGKISSSIMEIHGLVFSELFHINSFEELNFIEIGQLLSCFYPLKIPDDKKCITLPDCCSYHLSEYIKLLKEKMNYYLDEEIKYNLDVGYSYDIQYDMIYFIQRWCEAKEESSCLLILKEMKETKEIFLGDFVKCCTKMMNIIKEITTICEYTNSYKCLEKINNLEKNMLKYVINNISLYI